MHPTGTDTNDATARAAGQLSLAECERRLHESNLAWMIAADAATNCGSDDPLERIRVALGVLDRLDPYAPCRSETPEPVTT